MNRALRILVAFTCVISVPAQLALIAPSVDAAPSASSGDESSRVQIVPNFEHSIPAELSNAYGLAQQLSEEHPDDFGFPTINSVDMKIVLPVVSIRGHDFKTAAASVKSTLELFDEVFPSKNSEAKRAPMPADALELLRNSTVFAEGITSRRATEEVKDAVFDMAIDPLFAEANAWQSEVDPFSGQVIIRAEKATRQLMSAIATRFGAQKVAVRVQDRPETYPSAREADTSPYKGGAEIWAPAAICSSGFSWYYSTTSMMLTAGHCAASGGKIFMPTRYELGTVTSGTRESWADGIGTVYLTGNSAYRGDIAVAEVNSSFSSQARIYRGSAGSGTTAVVGEMWSRRAQAGDSFCTGGARSGEICGWTVSAAGVNHAYSNGEVARNVVVSNDRQGWCTRPGDSGGPVYTVRSDGKVAAKGVISGGGGGGSDYYGGLLDQCFAVFTDIYDPYYAFPGNLKTG